MRVTGQIHPLLPAKVFRPDAAVNDSFLSNKRDKRLIKHSSFVSRIASSSARVGKARKRTRRPGNKLATTLDSLADALPDLDDDEGGNGGVPEDGKVRHRSLKSKKGALKRKEMIVRGEMERFGASMARLTETQPAQAQQGTKKTKAATKTVVQDANSAAPTPASAPAPATSNRWAALRGYISATMEQNPAFAGKN